ncbi:alpha/beta hydrolase [Flammeovirga sp. EKP202]|uniref:alpha/beta hydrolase n=1 Tax=Flammeovirga sp. EKP202 TaxID=2770592 RepID=UPI00165F6099|nr:alpha/beta hydrolase [Flammeovirga sp. EKP202]MBD0401611.1 alpha/beta hydrolase [Flammeovirga sp. EKP202]
MFTFKPATQKKYKHPLVLIHGALFNGEAWRGNFLDYFAALGYDTYAIHLSGHGQNESKLFLNLYGLDQYTEDVIQLITSLEEKPILIGHSMGGLVTQLVGQKVKLQAAVLLAAVPPFGVFRAMSEFFLTDPFSWGKFAASALFPFGKYIETTPPEGIYTTLPSLEIRQHVNKNMQRESIRALLEMMWRDFEIDASKISFPMAHVGFRDDKIIFPEDVEKTAQFYETEAKIFENRAHAFMFEPNWKEVGEYVQEWLQENALY